MLTHVKTIMDKYGFSPECKQSVIDASSLLLENGICDLISPYYTESDCDLSEISYKVKLLADQIGLNEYRAHLALYLIMSKRLKEYYVERKLPQKSYDGVINDLKYKAEECFCVHGVWGTFVSGWFVGFFKLQRFCFGRLQCELLPFGKLFGKFNLTTLHPDTLVINVHIPRSGERLTKDFVAKSYLSAKEFFSSQLNGSPTVFTCESWLLYPKNLEVLGENSNLREFINDYQIIHHATYPDYKELWRLFDVNYDGNPDHLPQNTSLRRAYVSWVKQGLPIGYGLGVYFYDDKRRSVYEKLN